MKMVFSIIFQGRYDRVETKTVVFFSTRSFLKKQFGFVFYKVLIIKITISKIVDSTLSRPPITYGHCWNIFLGHLSDSPSGYKKMALQAQIFGKSL